MSTVIILHSQIHSEAARDEQDVLTQVKAVSKALQELGYEAVCLPFSLNLESVISAIGRIRPSVIFNLVETVDGQGRLIHLAPAVLDYLHLPYTGSKTEALFLTSHKLLAKTLLKASGVPTPAWVSPESAGCEAGINGPGSYIVKAVWEHASLGLDDSSVITVGQMNQLQQNLERARNRLGRECFAEAYIEGREFNLSLLAGDSGPMVLPLAEIHFPGYPSGKLKIVGYQAKWEEESFEYRHTLRSFDFSEEDRSLLLLLTDLAKKCWDVFGLRGYARVDFRVDPGGRPWVLEVNANPCLSPDSGFAAAARQAGLSFTQVVRRIMETAQPCEEASGYRSGSGLERKGGSQMLGIGA